MLGVLVKTSLVLLLCVCITVKFGHSCPVENCDDCSGPVGSDNECRSCNTGFYLNNNGKDGQSCRKIGSDRGCGGVSKCGVCTGPPGTKFEYCRRCRDGFAATKVTSGNKVLTCSTSGPGCFSGSSTVSTPRGNVAMERVNVGDSVLTEIGNNQLSFTKVVGFTEREPATEGHFLSITAVNQAGHTHTVQLTATHNIYVKTKMGDDHDDYIPRFAEDVSIGDMLKIQTENGAALNEATITHVTLHKEIGVFAPLTETGTMLVDGTLVSCYASFDHQLAHILTAPIRWFPWLFADEGKPLQGKLPYVEVIKYIGRNYVVPIVSLK